MIVGQRSGATGVVILGADVMRVNEYAIDRIQRIGAGAVLLDGLGAGVGDQVVRLTIYGPADELVAVSDEIIVPDGSPATWRPAHFTGDYAAAEVLPGNINLGLHSGAVHNSANAYRDETANARQNLGDTYADGPAAVLGSSGPLIGRMSMVVSLFDPYTPPEDLDDEVYARLPFELAQRVFAGGTISASRILGRAGFHGTSTDPEEGAFAIARTGGPMADLVGERIRVSRRVGASDRAVFVYVHDEQEWPDDITDEDLSLTRRAWLELAPWPSEAVDVTVEVVA